MDIQGSWAYHSSMHRRRGDIVHHLTRREKKKVAARLECTAPARALVFPPGSSNISGSPCNRERAARTNGASRSWRPREQIFFFVTDASPDHNQCGVLSRRTDRSSQSIHLAVRFHVAGERRRSFFPDAV